MHCTNCGAAINAGSRFCTECGRPVAAAQPVPPAPAPGPAARPPVPPVMPPAPMSQMVPPPPVQGRPAVPPPPIGQPPVVPPAPPMNQPAYVPPAPVAPAPVAPAPVAPAPVAPAPVAPAPVAQAEAAPATLTPVPAGLGVIRSVTGGDLFNNGIPVAVYATDTGLVLLPSGGAPRIEDIQGLRHAIVGDFDGDGTQDLALFSESHVWVMRFSQFGGIPSGKVALQSVPEHLVKAPLTHDGKEMLMSVSREKVTFYVIHPSRGLVEIASTTVPSIEP